MASLSERRNPEQIVSTIYNELQRDNEHMLTISRLAERTSIDYNVVEKWVKLIERIQKLPEMEVAVSKRPAIVRIEKDISNKPMLEIDRGIRAIYSTPDSKCMMLWQLLKKGATGPKKAADLEMTPEIEELIKNKAIKKDKHGIYLTGNGILTAEGVRDIYGGNH